MAERRLFNLILSCYLMDGGGTDGGRSVVEVLVNNKDRCSGPTYRPKIAHQVPSFLG